jgi:hypothetical protein
MSDPVLHLDRVSKGYPGADAPVSVLDDVSLSLGRARRWP